MIGVRWLKKYYAQNARVIDERASVVAAQKERLSNIYRHMGVDSNSELMTQLIAANGNDSTGESQALMKRYNRDTRYTHGQELQAARQHFKRYSSISPITSLLLTCVFTLYFYIGVSVFVVVVKLNISKV